MLMDSILFPLILFLRSLPYHKAVIIVSVFQEHDCSRKLERLLPHSETLLPCFA